MNELKKLDINNKKYYLLDNARVHKTKKFNNYSHKIRYPEKSENLFHFL